MGDTVSSPLDQSGCILIFSLKPKVDERRGRGSHPYYNEEERPSRNRHERGAASSSRIASRVSHHSRSSSIGSGYFATPPPSATPHHAELEPTIVRGLCSPAYREQSSEDPWVPSLSYIVTPPSATIALPDLATAPIKSTLLPIRRLPSPKSSKLHLPSYPPSCANDNRTLHPSAISLATACNEISRLYYDPQITFC
jgi:hypothetical protein